MKKILPLLLIVSFIATESEAQFSRYIVRLKNKNGTPYSLSNPIQYLSQRAIDRRSRYGIPIDSTDLPVTPSYVSQISGVANVTVLNVSKWLNAVTIQTTDPNAITTISGFSFVQSVSGIAARITEQPFPFERKDKFSLETGGTAQTGRQQTFSDYYNYGANAYAEIHLHNGEFLHNIGLRGQGMQIGMLDAGFTGYATLHAMDSAVANGQILSTWDFVQGEADVNDHAHGMQCLSTIVANLPGQFVGKAPKASVYLFRTEDAATEYLIEEFNWSCGAERADSAGADVISTSLGYTTFDNASFNHTYADMNGNTTMAAIAADLAAKKGMLVFASVGNDGNGSWHYLGTPSDGDSVIAVGAVNSSGLVGSFSSYGPSSDQQVKPDVASVGVSAVVQNTNNTIGFNNGTSFACPNMAGLGTCLWQGFPEFNNIKIRSALWQAGSRSTNPDDRIGYGIPNMKLAFTNLLIEFATSSSSVNGCRVTINWTSKDVQAMRYEIERKLPSSSVYTKIGDVTPLPGTVVANHNYQFINDLTGGSQGNFSYRIRQIIDTAAASFADAYIDTTNITLSSPCVVTGINPVDPTKDAICILPNPAHSNLTIKINSQNPIENLLVKIVDVKGRVVAQYKKTKPAGVFSFELPVYNLANGKYVAVFYNGISKLTSKEFIKL